MIGNYDLQNFTAAEKIRTKKVPGFGFASIYQVEHQHRTSPSLVFQNPPNTFSGGVWNPKWPSQEVFGGPNIYSAGIWKTMACFAILF